MGAVKIKRRLHTGIKWDKGAFFALTLLAQHAGAACQCQPVNFGRSTPADVYCHLVTLLMKTEVRHNKKPGMCQRICQHV